MSGFIQVITPADQTFNYSPWLLRLLLQLPLLPIEVVKVYLVFHTVSLPRHLSHTWGSHSSTWGNTSSQTWTLFCPRITVSESEVLILILHSKWFLLNLIFRLQHPCVDLTWEAVVPLSRDHTVQSPILKRGAKCVDQESPAVARVFLTDKLWQAHMSHNRTSLRLRPEKLFLLVHVTLS